jgi:hypothetical protein
MSDQKPSTMTMLMRVYQLPIVNLHQTASTAPANVQGVGWPVDSRGVPTMEDCHWSHHRMTLQLVLHQ